MAAMTCDTSVVPCASATLRLTIREPGAMPRKRVLSVVYVDGRRAGVAAGDDAGHVRAVAEGVEVLQGRRLRLERQVRAVDHLVRRQSGPRRAGRPSRSARRRRPGRCSRCARRWWLRSASPRWSCRRRYRSGRRPVGLAALQLQGLSSVTARTAGLVRSRATAAAGTSATSGAERVLGGDHGAAERDRGRDCGGEAVLVGLDDDADARGRAASARRRRGRPS